MTAQFLRDRERGSQAEQNDEMERLGHAAIRVDSRSSVRLALVFWFPGHDPDHKGFAVALPNAILTPLVKFRWIVYGHQEARGALHGAASQDVALPHPLLT